MDDELVAAILAEQFPNISLPVEFLAEGEDFKVFESDGWAWRFPKRSESERWMLREGPLLDAIREALPAPVPQFALRGKPSIRFPFAFVGYHVLNGIPADLIPGATGPALAAQVGRFLAALHSVPAEVAREAGVPACGEQFSPEVFLARVREVCGVEPPGRLSPSAREACAAFLAGSGGIPGRAPGLSRLIHGDFEAEHILLDPVTGEITGILDWSDACLGDAARDFGALWAWGGEDFLYAVLSDYDMPVDGEFIRRVKFLGTCFALLDYQEALVEGEPHINWCLRQLDRVLRERKDKV